jgi:hypothetical protein
MLDVTMVPIHETHDALTNIIGNFVGVLFLPLSHMILALVFALHYKFVISIYLWFQIDDWLSDFNLTHFHVFLH